jgi:hypothetical protein
VRLGDHEHGAQEEQDNAESGHVGLATMIRLPGTGETGIEPATFGFGGRCSA